MLTTARLAVLAVVMHCALAGCGGDKPPRSSPRPQEPLPPVVELSLGNMDVVNIASPVGSDDFCMTSGPDGSVWVILQSSKTPYYTVRQHGSWTDVAVIPTQGWRFIERITAAVDKDGRPVVTWVGYDEGTGEAIASSYWSGSAWSKPEVLDRLEPSTHVMRLHSVADREGDVHIAYDRPLVPSEAYNLGGHGVFPRKTWHAVRRGGQWLKPRPTTGRGRYRADAIGLTLGPGGDVVLGVAISWPHSTPYIAEQRWDGRSWTKTEEIAKGAGRGLVATPWGDRFAWWSTDSGRDAAILRPGERIEVSVCHWGDELPVTCDPAGRIVLYERQGADGTVRVWNGVRWSEAVSCGEATKLAVSTEGELFAADWRSDGLHIQQIRVRELPSASAASQPGGPE
jgi:hypothetical protein